jgi:hypothetical protein
MKTLILLLLLLSGCAVQNRHAQKPFVVTEKYYIYSDNNNAEYRFVDASGKLFMYYDSVNLYEIGDTIK